MSKTSISTSETATSPSPGSPVATLVEPVPKIQSLLEAGRAQEALQIALARNNGTTCVQNARAVCHLRLGQPEEAVRVLRNSIVSSGGIGFRERVPEVYQINFGIALALTGNVSGAAAILKDLQHPETAEAETLRNAIKKWEKTLSWFEWLMWKTGVDNSRPVQFDTPPGTIA